MAMAEHKPELIIIAEQTGVVKRLLPKSFSIMSGLRVQRI